MIASIITAVYAGVILSNTLTANWTVKEPGTNLELWWNAGTPGGDLYKGTWYYSDIGLKNNGVATYNVIVKFRIWTDVDLATTDIKVQYYDGASWLDLPLTVESVGGRNILTGTFGPSSGFPVGVGYNQVTPLKYYFEGSAPADHAYGFDCWAEQI